jgi:3-hydroxyacyl-CoA dehydrogenase
LNPPLRHIKSLTQWACRDDADAPGAARPREVRSVAVIGAGIMGTAVAAASVEHGLPVVIIDRDAAALAAAPTKVTADLGQIGPAASSMVGPAVPASMREHGRHSRPYDYDYGSAASVVARLLRCTAEPGEVAGRDLVLESVTETASVKHSVYAALEPHLAATATLASNTSAIPIAQLAAGLAAKDRFCGLHFFHPVRSRPLVEVVRGPQTSDATIATAVAYARRIGKMPIVVRDGPGFLVNRLLVPYLTEALELLLDGVSLDQIDGAATQFGMAMGPLRLLDEIGLDTALLAGRVLWNVFPERIIVSPLLISMFKAGRLGRKCERGFFLYPNGTNGSGGDGPRRVDPELAGILAAWARPPRPCSPQDILTRLMVPMILEATRLLEESRISDPRSIDLGTIYGLGFPTAHGGLLYWADTLGPRRVLAMLQPLVPAAPRLEPTAMLLDMARRDGRFHGKARTGVAGA